MVGGWHLLPEKELPGHISEDAGQSLLVPVFGFGVDFMQSQKFNFRLSG